MMIDAQSLSGLISSTESVYQSHIKATNGFSVGDTKSTFTGVFQNALNTLQKLDDDASEKVTGLLSGEGTDIHTAMIATQKASLAFETALAVRNKAVGAYQQIMGMQF
jgi:flagellar hook-basal body complex protein FliE